MSSVYLDTCIVIYLVEAHPDHAPRLERLLEAHPVQLCVSPLVVMESLVLPLRHQRESQVRNFQRFFDTCRVLDMPLDVYQTAAQLRAQHGLKTPDALHLATARHHRCDQFWTNDDRLWKTAQDFARNLLA